MRIRYFPADPAGNLTGFVLTPVEEGLRAPLAARMMARCPEGLEQVAFIDEASLTGALPRMDMMGGEFCGNASRAFGRYAAMRRGRGETELRIRVSGAREPVLVSLESDCAYAQMPLPIGRCDIEALGQTLCVVRMEGIDHAVVTGIAPSDGAVLAVRRAMPPAMAQGVLFLGGAGQVRTLRPHVSVAATGTSVWESSCGSGSVAAAWLLAEPLGDGMHGFAFDEPGGRIEVRVWRTAGRTLRAVMGGRVAFGAEREIDI